MTVWSAQKEKKSQSGQSSECEAPETGMKRQAAQNYSSRPRQYALLKYCRVNNYPQLPGEGGGHDYPESRYSVYYHQMLLSSLIMWKGAASLMCIQSETATPALLF